MDVKLYGGFGVRMGHLSKGQATNTHRHNFPHLTYLRGPGRVEKLEPTNAEETQFRVVKRVDKPKGGHVFIQAGMWHRITALEDLDYDCLYTHRTPDGELTDEFSGWQAYE